MNKTIIWVILAIAVLVGVYLIFSSQGPSEEMAPVNQETSKTGGITTGPAPVLSTGTVQVDIKGFAFVSPTVRVGPGTKIVWKNFDDAPHSVIGSDFQSPVLAKGQTYSHVFTKEGAFFYYCGLHPNMKGEVVVRAF
jgi:plastocyanin